MQEEKTVLGHKLVKYKLTFLLCGNDSDDCKVKHLLVHHSETPRVFIRNNVIKGK